MKSKFAKISTRIFNKVSLLPINYFQLTDIIRVNRINWNPFNTR